MARFQLYLSDKSLGGTTYQNDYKHVQAKWSNVVVFFFCEQIDGSSNE